MKKKDRKPKAAGKKRCWQTVVEDKAVKEFNAELQKEIDRINWAKAKLPRQSC